MPDTPYVPPAFSLSDAEQVSVIKESLDRAILTRQNILNKPKPTYDIDGQRFEWNDYLYTIPCITIIGARNNTCLMLYITLLKQVLLMVTLT